ncbi:SRPBCC family protein [Streptomyces sp. R08]|uniref:SRPBCC family protein n=1 Tax=Streptomyces sp. R08 TaxID=3238624 RepID=A0AB39MM40_9ACTN
MKKYTTSRTVAATPQQVWALIATPSDFGWRSDVRDVVDDGFSYSEISKRTGYATDYTVTHDEPNRRRDTRLKHIDGTGTRSFVLTANSDTTTTVKIVEEFAYNGPWITQPLVDIFLRWQQKTYVKDLEKALS